MWYKSRPLKNNLMAGVDPDHVALRVARLPLPPFFIDNLLVRNHFIILMIRWTGLASWEFEFPCPGSLTSTFPQVSILTMSLCASHAYPRNRAPLGHYSRTTPRALWKS